MTTTKQGTMPAARAPGSTEGAEVQDAVRLGHGALLRAAQKSIKENSVTFEIAGVGTVRLPGVDALIWIGSLAALAAFEIVEWPVALAMGAGHVLANQHHMRLIKDFGEALEGV